MCLKPFVKIVAMTLKTKGELISLFQLRLQLLYPPHLDQEDDFGENFWKWRHGSLRVDLNRKC